ncbi:hypothetical protein PAXRUDRAFT_822094 [Paxillus rubicundulus Ve08.2h10]|uniref:Unplaced genomic scaffold scaffold_22, whole genome shotgun sequence n=1 Tax=Paxillus rubicundulus Ve08.2h10 TaxID=930991 RepID=A0A0D0DX21_9AGAM|nr:hypothetical protein PAXRUDRAFT_822094 [Paxillus rubicundulus Ve08.2h10]
MAKWGDITSNFLEMGLLLLLAASHTLCTHVGLRVERKTSLFQVAAYPCQPAWSMQRQASKNKPGPRSCQCILGPSTESAGLVSEEDCS